MNQLCKNPLLYISAFTLLIFSRSLLCDFVNIDDPQYVYLNYAIRLLDWQFVGESFKTSYMGWWMPLTWISFAVDYHFWQLNPVGYHLTNTLFHVANTALVTMIAARIVNFAGAHVEISGYESSPGAAPTYSDVRLLVPLLAGLLWGIHPLRVESVAWVTERKDVLSGFFSLSSILLYLQYVSIESDIPLRCKRSIYYLLSLFCFVLSMLAKPVSVVLPVMLIVLDWYPLGRFSRAAILRVFFEKIPFVLMSLAVALATIYTAAGESILISLTDYPLYKRFIVAGYALVEYVRLSIIPFNLVHLYVLPISFSLVHYVFAGTTLLACILLFLLRQKYPWLLAAWLLYLLPLLPVLGFFQNGTQSHADRFTYLPAVFPSILVAAIVGFYLQKLRNRSPLYGRLAFSTVIGALLCYSMVTFSLIGVWRNSATLWSRLIAVNPVGRAYYYRGEYYLRIGEYSRSIEDLRTSIELAQARGVLEIYNIHALLGDALNKSGCYDEAVKEFTTAIEMKPVPNYFYHRGLALAKLGRQEQANSDFAKAATATGPIVWYPLK